MADFKAYWCKRCNANHVNSEGCFGYAERINNPLRIKAGYCPKHGEKYSGECTSCREASLIVAEGPVLAPTQAFDPSCTTRKIGKVRVDLVMSGMPNALLELGRCMTWALSKGYKEGDWLDLPNWETSYLGADLRHKLEELAGAPFDVESGLGHDVHAAWNALAKLERRIRDAKAAGNPIRTEGSIK